MSCLVSCNGHDPVDSYHYIGGICDVCHKPGHFKLHSMRETAKYDHKMGLLVKKGWLNMWPAQALVWETHVNLAAKKKTLPIVSHNKPAEGDCLEPPSSYEKLSWAGWSTPSNGEFWGKAKSHASLLGGKPSMEPKYFQSKKHTLPPLDSFFSGYNKAIEDSLANSKAKPLTEELLLEALDIANKDVKK